MGFDFHGIWIWRILELSNILGGRRSRGGTSQRRLGTRDPLRPLLRMHSSSRLFDDNSDGHGKEEEKKKNMGEFLATCPGGPALVERAFEHRARAVAGNESGTPWTPRGGRTGSPPDPSIVRTRLAPGHLSQLRIFYFYAYASSTVS